MSNDGNTRHDTDRLYRVVSIEKADPPQGLAGNIWYQYVIARGTSIIEGMQAGNATEVRKHAEEFADRLNERAKLGVYTYSARKRNK